MDHGVQIAIIICATILILGLVGTFMFYSLAPDSLKGKTITVDGNSIVKANPDLVKIYFNMETNASTSSEATSLNAKQVDEMITSLVKLGLERSQIQTQNFNVYEWTAWENNLNVHKGYKATHQIVVELKENQFSLSGDVIDAGTNAEAMISYINFELSNEKENEYKALAYKQASQDSRVKAEAIAEGLGMEIKDVVSVSVSQFNYSPWPIYARGGDVMMAEASNAKVATTNLQPGEQEISGDVSVVYRIG